MQAQATSRVQWLPHPPQTCLGQRQRQRGNQRPPVMLVNVNVPCGATALFASASDVLHQSAQHPPSPPTAQAAAKLSLCQLPQPGSASPHRQRRPGAMSNGEMEVC